ncbi:MAG: dihydropteroate synthase [Chitinophagaceae bacterium]
MFTLNCKGSLVTLEQPLVMGIINATPDSFYQNSQQKSITEALYTAEKMINDGATFIDVGGQSTKPNAIKISADEELLRVIPSIEAIHKNFPEVLISIDTYYAKVAKEAVFAGACMVNDVSAGNLDNDMVSSVATLNVPYVCMHMQGTPQTMQNKTNYNNIVEDILKFFIQKIQTCNQAGIKDVIIDIGFGFGKTVEQNFYLLKHLQNFTILDKPILLGVSRKSTIYKTLNTTAENALNGTTVLNTLGLQNGANILRVHDVKEAMETVKLFNAFNAANNC